MSPSVSDPWLYCMGMDPNIGNNYFWRHLKNVLSNCITFFLQQANENLLIPHKQPKGKLLHGAWAHVLPGTTLVNLILMTQANLALPFSFFHALKIFREWPVDLRSSDKPWMIKLNEEESSLYSSATYAPQKSSWWTAQDKRAKIQNILLNLTGNCLPGNPEIFASLQNTWRQISSERPFSGHTVWCSGLTTGSVFCASAMVSLGRYPISARQWGWGAPVDSQWMCAYLLLETEDKVRQQMAKCGETINACHGSVISSCKGISCGISRI